METIEKINQLQKKLQKLKNQGKTIGFVPTMGYLHPGHLSLMELAREENDIVVISIFVNPTQFGPSEDYKKYPRDMGRDSKLAKEAGVNYIFHPPNEEIYGKDHRTYVNVEGLDSIMCGKFRPGHFRGVCTVVLKLFNIVSPTRAYFGKKDYQQLVIIKKMAKDLNLDIDIIGGNIVREKDNLALSSRNKYLSTEERKNATVLYESLKLAENLIKEGKTAGRVEKEAITYLNSNKYVKKVDYFDIREKDNLKKVRGIPSREVLAAAAIWVGNTRLIDNIIVKR
ncbi:MAG: pantoate--beta-alanine ligase [Actinomycetota bacterium]